MCLTCRVKAAPGSSTLFHDVAEIIFPDDEIFIVVFDDRALKTRGKVVVADAAVTEISGKSHAVGEQGNGFGGREDAGRSFDFIFAVERLAGAQFAENGDDFANRVFVGNLRAQLEAGSEFTDALGDDGDFGFEIGWGGKNDDVEAALQGGGHVIHATVA